MVGSKMDDLYLNIVSPEKSIFEGEISRVTLPGTKGSFTILPQHAPIISSLRKGSLSYVTMDGEECKLEIKEGFVELSNNVVSVCVNV